MKLEKLILENFRAYKERTTIDFNDLTLIIGKNDVGKSTILEALDIFFENRKLDTDDVNIIAQKNKENVKISAVFSDLPTSIDLDAGAKTNLKDEFLLNNEMLEIKKDFSSISKPKTFIVCNHPQNSECSELHYLKVSDLQKRVKTSGITGDFKGNVKNELRKAIWRNFKDNLELGIIDIEINKEGIKDIWKKIQPLLPLYALFQSDRKNDEKDSEIQDPMKFAVKRVIKRYESLLEKFKKRVEKEIEVIANSTIEKLNEMNEEIAGELKPQFLKELKWSDLFKPSITSDDIPMNKRGSGVRRLLLINFFRAEAERKISEIDTVDVIYAIEEPETAQHPDWQMKLMSALNELSTKPNTQVITTTHSPSLAGLVDIEDIRYIQKNNHGSCNIDKGSRSNLEDIASSLNLLPSPLSNIDKVKLLLCLEGPHDVAFFKNISHLFGLDIGNDERIVILSLGGGALVHCVNQNYLRKLNKKELHIYDRDEDAKYQSEVDTVNNRSEDGHYALLTQKREIENYFHEEIILKSFNDHDGNKGDKSHQIEVEFNIDDEVDVTELVAKLRHQSREDTLWECESNGKRYKRGCLKFVKSHLNNITSQLITKEYLAKRNALEEVTMWFDEIKKRIE